MNYSALEAQVAALREAGVRFIEAAINHTDDYEAAGAALSTALADTAQTAQDHDRQVIEPLREAVLRFAQSAMVREGLWERTGALLRAAGYCSNCQHDLHEGYCGKPVFTGNLDETVYEPCECALLASSEPVEGGRE